MAHFFVPGGADKSLYSETGEGGFTHAWKLTIAVDASARIGLWGGDDLDVNSNNPGVISTFERGAAPGQDRFISITGRRPGTTMLEARRNGSAPWCALQVEVTAPKPKAVYQTIEIAFVSGFVEGLSGKASPQVGSAIQTIVDEPGKFYTAYLKGTAQGFLDGGTELVEALVALKALAIEVGPQLAALQLFGVSAGVIYVVGRAAFDPAFRSAVSLTVSEAELMARTAISAMIDFAANYETYAAKSKEAGRVIGETIAEEINILSVRDAPGLGAFVGELYGRVAFEVLLAVITEGAGSALAKASKSGALARAVEKVAPRLAEELKDLRRVLRALHNDQRGMVKIAGNTLDREIELAFGEGAVLQRGNAGGFRILDSLPGLNAQQRRALSKLLGQELPKELKLAWESCGNLPRVEAELAEIKRLMKLGTAADRDAAYRLSEKVYGNWRDRFWRKVRGDKSLEKIFTDAGASFDATGAPYFDMGGAKTRNLTISLDHFMERRVDNPARAVDAMNLRPVIAFENSATLEAIRKDNLIKGWGK